MCIYTTPLELILSKIHNFEKCPPQAAGKKPTARGQKISSPKTPPFFARSPKWQNYFLKIQNFLNFQYNINRI
jgi:hypothetical protein